MKMEFDMTKVVEEIAMQAKENQEEFIIETIRPYCENILQIKINKEELKQILLNGMKKQQPFINKPCISKGVCHEDKINVLKKIRAEIIELRSRQNVGVLECLDIIDEYIEESDDE